MGESFNPGRNKRLTNKLIVARQSHNTNGFKYISLDILVPQLAQDNWHTCGFLSHQDLRKPS